MRRRGYRGGRPRIGAGIAIVVALLVAGAPLTAQVYLEGVRSPGVRAEAGALADPAAARALGIPLAADAITGSVVREGTLPVLVVLTRFADSPQPTLDAGAVDELLFTGSHGRTLPAYYAEQSGGRLAVEGTVRGWIASDVPLLDAAGSSNGHGWIGERIDEHITKALDALDPDLDFGLYDNDGPDGVPNSGDDDGLVDALAIKFLEVAGSCGGPGPWPHFGGLLDADGEPYATDDRTPSGAEIRIPVYVIDSVIECDGATPQGIGPLAHELGHNLGLPDYYRAVNGIEPQHRHWAAGCFDLMAAGSWACGDGPLAPGGFGPTGLSAFSRWRLGWAELQDVWLADDETYTLQPLLSGGTALRVWLGPESREAWIFEYRTREGFDAPLPAEGVLVYHYDGYAGPRILDPALPPAYPYHLVEADGDDALRKVAAAGGNRGVAGDVFAVSGPAGPLGWTTTPSTRDHLGGASTLEVHEIAVGSGEATVRLSAGLGFRVALRSVPTATDVLTPFAAEIVLDGGVQPYSLVSVLGGIPDVTPLLAGSAVVLDGRPGAAGQFALTVRVADATGRVVADAVSVRVLDDPALDAGALLRALTTGPALSAEREGYLDRSGNGNGALDLGDLRAFIQRQLF
jgi:M6 family metalloprotease-like protein